MRRIAEAGLGLFACGVIACGAPPPDPPTAVVRATPSSVCLGDDFATPIRLDASESAAGLTLVPVPPPEDAPELSYAWAFSGAEVRELGRGEAGVTVDVATAGDRPLHVQLTVRTAQGGEATTLHTVPITLPPARCAADGDCTAGERCLEHEGERFCGVDQDCAADAECSPCTRCDAAARRCVPERRE